MLADDAELVSSPLTNDDGTLMQLPLALHAPGMFRFCFEFNEFLETVPGLLVSNGTFNSVQFFFAMKNARLVMALRFWFLGAIDFSPKFMLESGEQPINMTVTGEGLSEDDELKFVPWFSGGTASSFDAACDKTAAVDELSLEIQKVSRSQKTLSAFVSYHHTASVPVNRKYLRRLLCYR